jgi:tetratricopeptide (TPR) repeat protein
MAVARGKIIDQDGNPLQGVTVWIEYWYMGPRLSVGAGPTGGPPGVRDTISETNIRRSGNEKQTREDGTFAYPDLTTDEEYRVRFEKDGFIPREEKRVFHVAGNDLGTFVLVSGNVEIAREGYEAGYAAFERRDFPAAITGMEEVVGVYGDSDSSDEMLVVALGVLGQAYLQQGQAAEAETSLNRLLEIRLDNPIAYRGLGQVAAMKGDMPQALDHFSNAVTLEPESAVGRYLYGFALQMTGQAAEAIPQLEACLAAQPSFVQAHKSLGMALADTGENTKAIEQLEAYLAAAGGAPDAAEVQAKIAELKQ